MRFGVTLNATVYEGTDAGEYLILLIAFTTNDLIKATLKSNYELYNLDFHKNTDVYVMKCNQDAKFDPLTLM